jgi:hypothetical protein
MLTAATCESCGMPLAGDEDHALTDPSIPYCNHCAPDGTLPSAKDRLEAFTQWMMGYEHLDHETALARAREQMKSMPAWRDADLG